MNPVARLRITFSNEFGRIYVSPILTEFFDTYPQISADVLMVDRIMNMAEKGFDIAVRIGQLPASGHSAVRVDQVQRVMCPSPKYLSRAGIPRTPTELPEHQIVSAAPVSPVADWPFGPDMQYSVRVNPHLSMSSVAAAINVAKQDWGLVHVLSYQVGPDLLDETLQKVLKDLEPEPLPIYLVHVEGHRAPAKVRALMDLLKIACLQFQYFTRHCDQPVF